MGLAAAGELTPLAASLAMVASSVAVVANARRLAGGLRSRETEDRAAIDASSPRAEPSGPASAALA